MTTDTDLANSALALIGEVEISAITDLTSKAARVCKQFAADCRKEVLRMGRWNCATKRALLTERLPAPVAGYAKNFTLPTDFIRLMDVNGEAVKESDEYFEIEAGKLFLTDSDSVWIRYIYDAPIGACDPLLQAAVTARLAARIAIPLSGRIEQAQALETLFLRRLSEARQLDAVETGNADNPAWAKVLDRSRMGRVRGQVRDPLRREG